MSRIVFLNGQYVPAAEATVSIMDRGFTFADGIYEVTAVARGKLVDNDAHLARLTRSLSEIGIDNPYTEAEWTRVCEELVARNGLEEGVVYMQVTRGVAERDFGIPADITPTAVAFTQVKTIVDSPLAKKGATVVTVPDLRWKRCDIKSVGLLPQVMAKQIAARAGAHEAWMTDGDRVRVFHGLHHHEGQAPDHAPAVECGAAGHHPRLGDGARARAWPDAGRAHLYRAGSPAGGRGVLYERVDVRDAGGLH
jgi:D-alanine transaminase